MAHCHCLTCSPLGEGADSILFARSEMERINEFELAAALIATEEDADLDALTFDDARHFANAVKDAVQPGVWAKFFDTTLKLPAARITPDAACRHLEVALTSDAKDEATVRPLLEQLRFLQPRYDPSNATFGCAWQKNQEGSVKPGFGKDSEGKSLPQPPPQAFGSPFAIDDEIDVGDIVKLRPSATKSSVPSSLVGKLASVIQSSTRDSKVTLAMLDPLLGSQWTCRASDVEVHKPMLPSGIAIGSRVRVKRGIIPEGGWVTQCRPPEGVGIITALRPAAECGHCVLDPSIFGLGSGLVLSLRCPVLSLLTAQLGGWPPQADE